MRRVTAVEFEHAPERYELRSGATEGAPPCPYGNQLEWVGYDIQKEEYVRFTKSVFKRLLIIKDKK